MGVTPIYSISINDIVITDKLNKHLVSLRITDEAGVINDTVELTLADTDLALPEIGSLLSVSLGYKESGLYSMGSYRINTVELSGPPNQMIIKAHGADFKESLKLKRSQSYTDTTLGQIVSEIAKRHGYKPSISKTLASLPIEHSDQTHESDMHFLTRLAKNHKAISKPTGNHLVFVKDGATQSASGIELSESVIDIGDVTSFAYSKKIRYNAETLDITMAGNPQLRVETPVLIQRFRSGIPKHWVITKATYMLTSSGFITSIQLRRPK